MQLHSSNIRHLERVIAEYLAGYTGIEDKTTSYVKFLGQQNTGLIYMQTKANENSSWKIMKSDSYGIVSNPCK